MSPADLERLERERLDADRRYNEALTALDRAVVDFASRSDVTGGDVPHLGSLLLMFLQQITAYVDTKDREATAAMVAALDTDRRALANEVPREPPSPRASTVEARPRRLRRAQPLPHRESWCRRLRIEIADVPECAAGKPRWSECRGWDSYGAPR